MILRKLNQIKSHGFAIPDFRFTNMVCRRAGEGGLRPLVAGESGVAAAALPPQSKTRWVAEGAVGSGRDGKLESLDLRKGQ